MFAIKPMPNCIDAALLKSLASVESADVGHQRYWGLMEPSIIRVSGHGRVTGTAVTVIAPGLDSSIIPHAISLARPGDVLVIDRVGDGRYGCLGGVVALAARVAGIAGIIVGGCVTDIAEIKETGLSVWCEGESALLTKLLCIAGAINVPASCGGVAVTAGAAVLADDSGICILPPEDIEDIVKKSAAAAEARGPRLEKLRAGERLGDLNGVSAKIEAAIKRTV